MLLGSKPSKCCCKSETTGATSDPTWPDWNLPVESSGGCCCDLSWWPQICHARLSCIHQWDEEPAGCHAELKEDAATTFRQVEWEMTGSSLNSLVEYLSISISRHHSESFPLATNGHKLMLCSRISFHEFCRRLENKGQEVTAGGNFGKDVKVLGKLLRCTFVFHKDCETKLDKPPTAKNCQETPSFCEEFREETYYLRLLWLSMTQHELRKWDQLESRQSVRRWQEETENRCDLRLLSDWPVLIFRASFDQSLGAERQLATHAVLLLFWWYE